MLAIKNSILVFAAALTAAFFTQSSCSQKYLKMNHQDCFKNTHLELIKSINLNDSFSLYNQGIRNIKCLKIEDSKYNCERALEGLRKTWQTKLKKFHLLLKKKICIPFKNTQYEEKTLLELSKINPKYLQLYAALKRRKIFEKKLPVRSRYRTTNLPPSGQFKKIVHVIIENSSQTKQNSTVRNLKEHNSYKKYLIEKKLLRRKRERQLSNDSF